jgi:hypothetical protein
MEKSKLAGGALFAVVVVAIAVAASAFKPIVEIRALKYNVQPSLAADGGALVPVALSPSGGNNTAMCWVPGSLPVYFGGSNVSVDGGMPFCAAATCVGSTISVDTYHGQLYYVAPRRDGGTAMHCMFGR